MVWVGARSGWSGRALDVAMLMHPVFARGPSQGALVVWICRACVLFHLLKCS